MIKTRSLSTKPSGVYPCLCSAPSTIVALQGLPVHLGPSSLSMVRLITHNLLACHAKGCTTNNFPLKFSNVKLALREADFNPDFLRGFLPRIEWDALVQASREVTKKFIELIGFSTPILKSAQSPIELVRLMKFSLF